MYLTSGKFVPSRFPFRSRPLVSPIAFSRACPCRPCLPGDNSQTVVRTRGRENRQSRATLTREESQDRRKFLVAVIGSDETGFSPRSETLSAKLSRAKCICRRCKCVIFNDRRLSFTKVATLCEADGVYLAQHMGEQGRWVSSTDKKSCMTDKLEILEYCKKVRREDSEKGEKKNLKIAHPLNSSAHTA